MGDIVSWGEPQDWREGGTVELYLIEGEYDIPLDYYPEEAVKGKQDALVVGPGLAAAGGILLLAGLLSVRGDKRRSLERARASEEKKILMGLAMASAGAKLDAKNRGNRLMGAVLTVLGLILVVAMGNAFLNQETLYEQLLSGYPLIAGAALLYMGWGEFSSERVTIDSGMVRLIRKSYGRKRESSVGLNTFAGIGENHMIRRNGSGPGRHYRDLVLLHTDPDWNDLRIASVSMDEEGSARARELAEKLGLPLTETI